MNRYLLILFGFFMPSVGLACSCYFDNLPLEESVNRSFNDASAVVLAKVLSIETYGGKSASDEGYISRSDIEIEITQFRTLQSWKGEHGETFKTRINTACCMCGYAFSSGASYLLYLYGPDDEGYYAASTCSRTTRATNADEEIEVLNRLVSSETDDN
ncbi:hypothetical protein CWE13_02790 [Aliidiomarina shirensis]|uniref:Uncharacterized protein n=1 Tax=Aliidiomarina shirensis TaxID=1048642 RepID=A0A432WXV2_9GAMM|nr:hypothetical protein [Aliidiomarina shirensis]RUO38589.1 hypothetical protein CWE13_02790 [Aliidiomarina shirensis]